MAIKGVNSKVGGTRAAKPFTLGRESFAHISRLEGMELSAAMRRELRRFDREKLTAEERRRRIIRKYGKPA